MHRDRLRNAEVFIIILVLLLWCCSIYIFIRHSEMLRIRYRDIPYYPSIKSPMNLNHITVVHRISDAVIHSKPASTSATTLVLNHSIDHPFRERSSMAERQSLSVPSTWNMEKNIVPCESNPSIRCTDSEDHLLDPQLIPRDIRRKLLDLHRRSMDTSAGFRHSIQYTTNDLPTQKETEDEYQEIGIVSDPNKT